MLSINNFHLSKQSFYSAAVRIYPFRRSYPYSMKFKLKLIALWASLLLLSGCKAAPVYDPDPEPVPLPAIMYHSILKSQSRAGTYVVSPSVFREDMLYLLDNGYETVFIEDLIEHTEGDDLPEKPVLVTLDDGYLNNLTYILPILEELDIKAVISVVGSYTVTFSETPDPNPNYAHLSYEDINAITASGHVEIQNHSYDMHSQSPRFGSKRRKGEASQSYKAFFCGDCIKLQQLLKDKCGITPTAYTYPFGAITPDTTEYLKELGFKASLGCEEKCNYITRDPECLFLLGRYNRPSGISTWEFMQRALKGSAK